MGNHDCAGEERAESTVLGGMSGTVGGEEIAERRQHRVEHIPRALTAALRLIQKGTTLRGGELHRTLERPPNTLPIEGHGTPANPLSSCRLSKHTPPNPPRPQQLRPTKRCDTTQKAPDQILNYCRVTASGSTGHRQ